MDPHSITQNMLPRSRNYKWKIDDKKGGKLTPKCYVDQPDSLLNSRGWENPTFTDENPYHLEGEQPQLGDLPGTVINHLLNGMILQVRPQKTDCFLLYPNARWDGNIYQVILPPCPCGLSFLM